MATSNGARPYGGVSDEDRRADRRQRLVSATLDLVGEQGVAAVTVGAVCTRASLAKRYFYEGFDSLDDLLSTTLDLLFGTVSATIDALDLADADPTDLVTTAVRGAVDAMDDPRVARLYLESAANPSLLRTRDAAIDGFVAQLLERVLGGRPATPADELLGQLLVSGTTHVVALWLRGRLDLTRDELVAHLVALGAETGTRMRVRADTEDDGRHER